MCCSCCPAVNGRLRYCHQLALSKHHLLRQAAKSADLQSIVQPHTVLPADSIPFRDASAAGTVAHTLLQHLHRRAKRSQWSGQEASELKRAAAFCQTLVSFSNDLTARQAAPLLLQCLLATTLPAQLCNGDGCWLVSSASSQKEFDSCAQLRSAAAPQICTPSSVKEWEELVSLKDGSPADAKELYELHFKDGVSVEALKQVVDSGLPAEQRAVAIEQLNRSAAAEKVRLRSWPLLLCHVFKKVLEKSCCAH